MSAVIDRPDVDTIILDEAWLDPVISCRNCDSEAEWRWSTRCCNEPANLCDTHDAAGYRTAADILLTSRAMCGACGKVAGYGLRFTDFYRRHEL